MTLLRLSCMIAASAAVFLTGAAAVANEPGTAEPFFEIGTLSCTGGEGIGLVVGSQKSYDCTFKTPGGRVSETYRANVIKIGLDLGVTSKSTMVWNVLSASQTYEPRSLEGNYAGASADASLGIGGGAKVLLGGSKNSVALQPVSVQGQTGFNIAVGVAQLQLR
jgi:hypothetical protein